MKPNLRHVSSCATALLFIGLLTSCSAKAVRTETPFVAANCEMATRLPLIESEHLLLISPTSAVLCDGPMEIRVKHPASLGKLLDRSVPTGDTTSYYCPLDDGSRISIVLTGYNKQTHHADGQLITVHTSGCQFASTTTGSWILSAAAWSALERLDPALRKRQGNRVVVTANRHCCATQTQ